MTQLPQFNWDRLPFPVAYPLHFANDATLAPSARLDNLIFATYQAMRTTALLLLADYLEDDTIDPKLSQAIRGLRMPHWGEWSILASALANYWQRPDKTPAFPQLAANWLRVNNTKPRSEWQTLLQNCPGHKGRALSPNEAIWKLRNDRAHRQATQTEDKALQDLKQIDDYLPVVTYLIAALFNDVDLRLLRKVSDNSEEELHVIELHGIHADLQFIPQRLDAVWAGAFDPTGIAVLAGERAITVYPFLVSADDDDEILATGLTEHLMMLDGMNPKAMLLLGVHRYTESMRHVQALVDALANKQIDIRLSRDQVKPWTVSEWSRLNASEDLSAIRNRKYFPDWYVERPDVDQTVLQRLEVSGLGLLLLGDAGSGKSSLLARLVENLLSEPEALANDATHNALYHKAEHDLILYLTGPSAYQTDAGLTGPELLMTILARKAGIIAKEFTSLTDFLTHLQRQHPHDSQANRKTWLILDGLNEADRYADLITALDDVLPSLTRFPQVRLVMSMRSGAYSALRQRHLADFRHGAAVFRNEIHLHRFTDPTRQSSDTLAYLDVRPFRPDETERAYHLHRQHLPDKSCQADFTQLPSATQQLLASPLYLHLFHNTYAGSNCPPQSLDQGRLLDSYLDHLADNLPAIGDTLLKLGKIMLERRSATLPVAIADAWLADWRQAQGYDAKTSVVKLDPIEELVSASLLLRPAEEGFGADRQLQSFQFAHQKLAERVLLRTLLADLAPKPLPDAQTFLAWARWAAADDNRADFAELAGALQSLIVNLSEAGLADVALSVLQLTVSNTSVALLSALLRHLGPMSKKPEPNPYRKILAALEVAELINVNNYPLWSEAVWAVRDWLLNYGYHSATLALETCHLNALSPLAAAEPGRADLQRDVWVSFVKLGDLALQLGQGELAGRYFQDGLVIIQALAAAEPGRADLCYDLAISYLRIGDFQAVLNTLKPLREQGLRYSRSDELWDYAWTKIHEPDGQASE